MVKSTKVCPCQLEDLNLETQTLSKNPTALGHSNRRILGLTGLAFLLNPRLLMDPVKRGGGREPEKDTRAVLRFLPCSHECGHTQRQIDLMDIKIWFPFLASP